MPISDEFILPSEEELTVQEINISTPALKAGANHFGVYCLEQSKEFMLCKSEESDPRKCMVEGKAVTSCALDFFQRVKGSCRESFEDYADCLENSSCDMTPRFCRKTQAAYDTCMLEKMGIERPKVGFFGTPKIHNTTRPKPDRFPQEPVDKSAVQAELPDDYPREPAKHGSRFYFIY